MSEEDGTRWPQFSNLGDSALMVKMGEGIDPDINDRVRNLASSIESNDIPGVREVVPTYSSLAVHYNPMVLPKNVLEENIILLCDVGPEKDESKRKVVLLPTYYGGEQGPDLSSVCELTNLDRSDVIQTHSGTDYRVYALGFSPGFPYLGGLDVKLYCSRLDSPRIEVPAGSVAIAENQTGVYPVASPGGWRIIGRTPVRLFDPFRKSPALLNPGDYLRFVPIYNTDEYEGIFQAVLAGNYTTEVLWG